MNRRDFLKNISLGTAGLLCAGYSTAQDPKPARPMNVLFIAIDDMNDWIGCLGGHPDSKTPHLDRLAARGVLFTKAYCSAPACNPSRASLMTGILPSTSGVYHNPQPWRPVMPKAVTIPQHFMAHGYNALGGGKIYHGAFPDPPSWESYFPSQKQNKPPDPVPKKRPVNGIRNTAHFDWGNHSLRTKRWRYIRYQDGTEELYDHDADEMEWTNLASKGEHAELKKKLARWLPKVNAPDAPRGKPRRAARDKSRAKASAGKGGRKTRER